MLLTSEPFLQPSWTCFKKKELHTAGLGFLTRWKERGLGKEFRQPILRSVTVVTYRTIKGNGASHLEMSRGTNVWKRSPFLPAEVAADLLLVGSKQAD